MRTIQIIALLLAFFTINVQAQKKSSTTDQERSIEINNDNGDLSISFVNSEITEFIVNDIPVATDRYEDYQANIDDFRQEEKAMPTTPDTDANTDDSALLRTSLLDYLIEKGLIQSETKFKIQLTKNELSVDGQEISDDIHKECLDIFQEIYGHSLTSKSMVFFKKSKNNSKSSISIIEE